MKYFIVLEAVKNRRIESLFVDLRHELFGHVIMLLPRLDTMSGSSRSLECHIGICNELLKSLSDAGEKFLPTCSIVLRMDILEIQPQCTSSNVDIELCQFLAEFHVTHSCLAFSLRMLSLGESSLK